MWIVIALVALLAAYLVWDWRRSGALRRRLADGSQRPSHQPGGDLSADARSGLDAHAHQTRSQGGQGFGGGGGLV